MTVKLSPEQEQALKQHNGCPLPVVDAAGKVAYVLLPADLYQRVRLLLESDDLDVRQTYPLQEQITRAEGWDEPEMDDYNDYDANCRQT